MVPVPSMNLVIALSVATFAFHLGATVLLVGIARAPGWERVRIVTLLAASAGLYSLVNIYGALPHDTPAGIGVATTLNITIAAVHAAGWLWFTFSDERGRWRSLPRWVRRLSYASVGFSLLLTLAGAVVTDGAIDQVAVPLLEVRFAQARMSDIGTAAMVLILSTLLASFVEQWRRARRGVPGARAIVAGFTVFLLCSVEEALVSMGALEFIYLAEIGYLALIAPVTLELVRRFTRDAHRLAHLSERLADEVEVALAERDSAREALHAQERMAALGRIASGIGHEVNNPLQYLTFSLEEIREGGRPFTTGDGAEAIANAFDAIERIKRIVEGLRAYATPLREGPAEVDLHEVVRTALRVAAPQLRGVPVVRQVLRPVPAIRGDEGKLVQAVVNAVLNSLHVLTAHPPAEPASITVATQVAPSGDVEVEVRDNGPGFPPELLPTLGQPFVTTRATDGGSGLGIFVIRGIVDAHGGTVTLENAPFGGAVLRLRLPVRREPPAPPAPQGTTAVASISTTAPASISADTSTAVIAG